LIKPIRMLKNRPVLFWFYKSETKKNRTKPKSEKKPSQTRKNQSQTGKTEPNQKNQTKPKKLV